MTIDIFELLIEFRVLDAATARCLPGYERGVVAFTRHELTSGSAAYLLREGELGDLGRLELHTMRQDVTDLHIHPPPEPEKGEVLRYSIGDMEADFNTRGAALRLLQDGIPTPLGTCIVFQTLPIDGIEKRTNGWTIVRHPDEWHSRYSQAQKKLKAATVDLHTRRKEHQRLVLEGYFRRLHDEGFPLHLLMTPPEAHMSASMLSSSVAPSPALNRRDKTRRRAEVCKAIKDENPRLSYVQVADRATGILGEAVSERDVQNDYKAMGWKWIPANSKSS